MKNVVGSFADDEPKSPLHIGEAMSCWTYVASIGEALIYEEIALNTTTDAELRKAVEESVHVCRAQVQRVRDFMEKEGVPSPPLSESKPQSDSSAIPYGAKLTDEEIANGLSIKVASATVACASSIAQSIRNDVGLMWMELQQEQVTIGVNIKTLMRRRGWLKVPPMYHPPGSPIQ